MATLYLYNCNNLNEFLEQIETDDVKAWKGCSTEVPPAKTGIIGRSFAFNPETNEWDVYIDDWRGITLYNKQDSRITKAGEVGEKSGSYIEIAPPEDGKRYIWNEDTADWQEFIEMVNTREVIKSYEDAIQNHIDFVAKARGYDNGYTCASYFEDKNARYASDAHVFKDWRSDVWVYVNQLLNSYQSAFEGEDEIPASALVGYPTPDEVIAQLPQIEWKDITEAVEEE